MIQFQKPINCLLREKKNDKWFSIDDSSIDGDDGFVIGYKYAGCSGLKAATRRIYSDSRKKSDWNEL